MECWALVRVAWLEFGSTELNLISITGKSLKYNDDEQKGKVGKGKKARRRSEKRESSSTTPLLTLAIRTGPSTLCTLTPSHSHFGSHCTPIPTSPLSPTLLLVLKRNVPGLESSFESGNDAVVMSDSLLLVS